MLDLGDIVKKKYVFYFNYENIIIFCKHAKMFIRAASF